MSTDTIPSSNIDLFTDEAILDPYPLYAELRATAPVVYLPKWDLWAVTRYRDVVRILEDWQAFSSSAVTLNAASIEMGTRPGNILSSDPPRHEKMRAVLADNLSPRVLRRTLGELVDETARRYVQICVDRVSFDAFGDLAAPFIAEVVGQANGIPREDRARMAEWAEMALNLMGVDNERSRAAFPQIIEMMDHLHEVGLSGRLVPGTWGRSLYDAIERGQVTEDECHDLLSAFVVPAIDTTSRAIPSAIMLFARHPDQWDAVRSDPTLVPSAFREVLRVESPAQSFGRLATRDVEIDSHVIPEGAHVLVSVASANRDERHWPDPDRFDIHRDNVDILSFGRGIHSCVGQGMARMEAHAVLTELAARVTRFELDGQPIRNINNMVRGLKSLPVRVTTA